MAATPSSTTPPTNIIHEGWLIKSPPSNRVWRPKWRRRWFSLRQSTEVPGQYFLDYFSDRHSRKLKGTIDLELCEQVDAGLRMQRRSNDGTAVKGSVFSIRTHSRIYHLEADCVTEMEKWVDIICRVCGMKSTEEKFYTRCNNETTKPTQPQAESGPYIAISECITGPPKGNSAVVFSFNQRHKIVNNSSLRGNPTHQNQSRSYVNAINLFNNSGNFMRNVLRASDQPMHLPEGIYQNVDNVVTSKDSNKEAENLQRGLARLSVNDGSIPGTSMPPRPPKPSYLSLDNTHKDSFIGPRINEPNEIANSVPFKKNTNVAGSEYLNLTTPPIVNRGLKPRRIPNHRSMFYESDRLHSPEDSSPKLQYLDLDLDTPNLNGADSFKGRTQMESATIYKTVDFLKTQALNMTRMDTEAYRRKDVPS